MNKIAIPMTALLTFTLLTGCSKVDTEDYKYGNSETIKEQTKKASSQILDIAALNGKVTEPGPMVAPCSGHSSNNKVYRTRHPWSVYDVSVEQMKEAMDRLRKNLPENGWDIVKDGRDDSRAKSPLLVANHKGNDFSVEIRLLDERSHGDNPSLLEVTVESACYKSRK